MDFRFVATDELDSPRDALHVAWTTFQRRQVSMADMAGFECVFMPITASGRIAKGYGYLTALVKTVALLRRRHPRTVWVQLPQVPLLWAALIYKHFFRRDARIVADCHNALFRPPWSRFPLGLRLLHFCDCILVHNAMVRVQAIELGVPASKVAVLEDVPPVVNHGDDCAPPAVLAQRARPWVLMPGSFAADEPIEEVLAAARLAPDVTFVITGRTENAKRNGHDISHAPPNLIMPGFVPVAEFDRILCHADVVLGLTRVEGIQLSVCNEALGYGKPLIVSNTAVLSKLFGAVAPCVDSTRPADIVDAVRNALENAEEFARQSSTFATTRRRAWSTGPLDSLMRRLA